MFMDNIKGILNKIGYTDLKELSGEYQCRPLYRDSDNSTALVIQKSTGLYYDFVEKSGGNLLELIQRTLKLQNYNEAQKILIENGLNIDEFYDSKKYENLIITQKTFNKNMLLKLIKDHSYWENRGISKKILEDFNGGITFNGRMTNRYVTPIFNFKDELVGFAGRILKNDKKFPKWVLIGAKKEWVFPIFSHEYILEKKEVILVESLGDCFSLREIGVKNVLVLFGIKLSPKIISYLLKCNIKKIKIALNDDGLNNSAGNKAAEDAKKELLNYFDENQIEIIMPKFNDWNEWLLKDRVELEEFCKEKF